MRLKNRLEQFDSILHNSKNVSNVNKKTTYILLFFMLFLFMFNFLLRINEYHHPFYDDYYYIENAQKIQQLGGVTDFWSHYIQGILPKGIPPLYMFFLSPFTAQSSSFLNWAHYINLIAGFLMILSVYWCGKRLFGDVVGLISAFLISINPSVVERTALLAAENLLLLFSTVSIFFFIKGFQQTKYWIIAFALSGLAFLSKFNGIFLPTAFYFAFLILLLFKWKELENKKIILTLFLIFSCGMLIFFNKIYPAVKGEMIDLLLAKVAEQDITQAMGGVHGHGRYNDLWDFITTDFWGFGQRILWGVTRELHRYAVGLFVSVEWNYKDYFSFNWGWFIVPFFIFLLTRELDFKRKTIFITFAILVFLGCVPRSAVNHGTAHYSIMVIPIYFFYLSPLLYQLGLWIIKKFKINYKLLVSLIFVLLFSVNGIIYHESFNQFALFPRFEKSYQMALDWFKANIKKGDVIICDTNSKLQFGWYLNDGTQDFYPSVIHGKTISSELLRQRYSAWGGSKYFVVDGHATSPYDKSQYRYFFQDYIDRKNGFLQIKKIPEQFELVFQDHNPPKRIIIFKVTKD